MSMMGFQLKYGQSCVDMCDSCVILMDLLSISREMVDS